MIVFQGQLAKVKIMTSLRVFHLEQHHCATASDFAHKRNWISRTVKWWEPGKLYVIWNYRDKINRPLSSSGTTSIDV